MKNFGCEEEKAGGANFSKECMEMFILMDPTCGVGSKKYS